MKPSRVFKMSFARIYPQPIQKAEKKGIAKIEKIVIICWLTGNTSTALKHPLDAQTNFQTFFTSIYQLIYELAKKKACIKTLEVLKSIRYH